MKPEITTQECIDWAMALVEDDHHTNCYRDFFWSDRDDVLAKETALKLARYEKALQFYADEKNYCFVSTGEGELGFDCPINNDRGATARAALEAKE